MGLVAVATVVAMVAAGVSWAAFIASTTNPVNSFETATTFPTVRSDTVEFYAGQQTGATGADHNVKQEFAARTFSLAESGVDITDAFVEVAGQIGAASATT